ncbi:hypothetical protein PTTG_25184 [Puccinia triticina 1-1 BBBD Race 1]|uniref:Uncharacterized protein n=1 Tax=Puccinia triticina (isolate 1-1 / race 1 (BBBD)) TaxID=630390 RepID=A0A180H5W9_PUCT1|nr:hypothetical protein PTTG_25184 [Puccinia triticina 1-1 BBBD Race 1]
MSDTKLPTGRLYPKPKLGAIPGLRTVDRTTPKNPTIKSVLGPQLSTNDLFRRRLGRIPSSDSHGEGPSLSNNNRHDGNESFLLNNGKGKGREVLDDLPEETTFQPRLTGRVIGSSSNNWRRTEPPPHVNPAPQPQSQHTGQVDLNSLIAEMRFQRKLDQARLNEDRARREEDRARREAEEVRTQRRCELDESAKTSAIINAAINKLDPEDILKPDGSNVRLWEDALRLTAFKRFNNQLFFTPSEDSIVDPYFETIARGIIHSSVHSDLSYDLVDFENSAAVYEHLLSKFCIINRAKQLHTWEIFKKISLSNYNSLAEAIAAIDQCARTFREQGVTLTWDTIVSFIFQGNLRDHLGSVVDRKVDLFMETHDFELPSAGDILRFWEAARTEHRLAEESG